MVTDRFSTRKIIRAIIAWPSFLIGLFFLAALLGSIFPANNGWQEPDEGVELFVETNGVHVSLIIPMQAAGEDFSDIIRPSDLKYPEIYGTHAMIGWGDDAVYRSGESWAKVRIADILNAATGSEQTLLHVYHRTNPRAASHRRALRVTQTQYRYIAREIRATFRLNADRGSAASSAYGDNDLFYAATGRYSAVNTCNEWVGSLLRGAGVRVGRWTPFSGGVMRWFDAPAATAGQ